MYYRKQLRKSMNVISRGSAMIENTIATWHKLVATKDAEGLDKILAENVVFHSPVVHTPQVGKPITTLYLTAALHVLNNDTFKYLREVISGNTAVLEFSTVIEGITINGVDMITWNPDGRINDFKVMIRPLKAINLIHRMMGEMLQKIK
jgi:ketosteroid isomerase-like protein